LLRSCRIISADIIRSSHSMVKTSPDTQCMAVSILHDSHLTTFHPNIVLVMAHLNRLTVIMFHQTTTACRAMSITVAPPADCPGQDPIHIPVTTHLTTLRQARTPHKDPVSYYPTPTRWLRLTLILRPPALRGLRIRCGQIKQPPCLNLNHLLNY
jgi:hypothetical protein